MARLVWAVLCDRVLVDRDTNQVSYIDVLEGLTARELPSGLPRVHVATYWTREAEHETLKVRFRVLPPGSSRATTEFETEDIELRRRHRINLNLQGAHVSVEGEYTVAVDAWDGERYRNVARLPLMIGTGSEG